jgi:hypothetical protein
MKTGQRVAKMDSWSPKSNNYDWAEVQDTVVGEKYRGLGFSSKMMKETLANFSGKKSFLRSYDIQHPAQINIRSKYKSKFVASDQLFGESTKVVGPKEANRIIEVNQGLNGAPKKIYTGFNVQASTKIPKDMDKPVRISKESFEKMKKKQKIRFIRKNGRIIPIKVKN